MAKSFTENLQKYTNTAYKAAFFVPFVLNALAAAAKEQLQTGVAVEQEGGECKEPLPENLWPQPSHCIAAVGGRTDKSSDSIIFAVEGMKYKAMPGTFHFQGGAPDSVAIEVAGQKYRIKHEHGDVAERFGRCLKAVVKQSHSEGQIKVPDKLAIQAIMVDGAKHYNTVAQASLELNLTTLQEHIRQNRPHYDNLVQQQEALQEKIIAYQRSHGGEESDELEEKYQRLINRIDAHPKAAADTAKFMSDRPHLNEVVAKAGILGLVDLDYPHNIFIGQENGKEVIYLPDTDEVDYPDIAIIEHMVEGDPSLLRKLHSFIQSDVYQEQVKENIRFFQEHPDNKLEITAEKYEEACNDIVDELNAMARRLRLSSSAETAGRSR